MMMELFKQSLTLMWQGMAAIFVVILVIYVVLLAFPKIFKGGSENGKKK
jgi:Na+-transporting methylmalonyl-CoA/oxaloacetate decarboxylase gamma subunit